ncbi:MAG: glycosyltransferase family 9 protein [bacterium]
MIRQQDEPLLRTEGGRQDARRILVIRTDRLGDLILSFPVIEALRAAYPRAEIDLLVSAYAAPLARLQRSVREVGVDGFPGVRGVPDLVRWLNLRSYDVALHLYPRPRLALSTFLARIPIRIGTRYRFYSSLFNLRVPLHRKDSGMHERDLNLLLLRPLGLSVTGATLEAGIRVPEPARAEIRGLLRQEGLDAGRPLIALHPGSGGSSLNWPLESFGRLAKLLCGEGFAVLVTGTEEERESVRTVVAAAEGKPIDLAGRLDLVRLAALLECADLVVTNSTGPLHLADALGTRVLGLFSPFRSALPDRWGPYSQPAHVLLPPGAPCDRCRSDSCADASCMERIRPEEVMRKIHEILAGRRDGPSAQAPGQDPSKDGRGEPTPP